MLILENCSDLPKPWGKRVTHLVGGLLGVGLSADTTKLLVVSNAGRSVIDLTNGERIARDRDSIPETEFQEDPFVVTGIGPLAFVQIPCAGLWGGSLPTLSVDNWEVQPLSELSIRDPDGSTHPLPEPDGEPMSVGLGFDGKVLIYATSASVFLYYRT
jgi:hypothetical protein